MYYFRRRDNRFPLDFFPPDTMEVPIERVVGHLSKYGYMDEEKSKKNPKEIPEDSIKQFQEFNGIEVTGKCDEETSFAMKLPRCSHKDVQKRKVRNLSEDVTPTSRDLTMFEGDKWEKKKLTWRVTKFSSQGMPKELVNESLRRAFYVWEKHADLTFVWVETGVPDLEIRWEVGDHGDGDAFDGSGGTLAHAFFPQVYYESPIFKCLINAKPSNVCLSQGDRLSGDLHFDDQEVWTLGTGRVGINLTQAAAHEIGHSLGLDHSRDKSALMAPIYRGYQQEFDLQPDDIRNIQALYGKCTSPPEPIPAEKEWTPTRAPPSGSSSGVGSVFPSCPCSVM